MSAGLFSELDFVDRGEARKEVIAVLAKRKQAFPYLGAFSYQLSSDYALLVFLEPEQTVALTIKVEGLV